ncbi:hypothetical protein N9954_02020 [Maribacter sp.]|nr:hypothetical protein [Maribacter sp.]
MENKGNTDQLVQDTLDSASGSNMVKTPPFFKEKVLNRMAAQKTEEAPAFSLFDRFTPRYQFAALICFVVLNTVALLSNTSNTSDSYSENVENFAQVYGLSETGVDSYLSKN